MLAITFALGAALMLAIGTVGQQRVAATIGDNVGTLRLTWRLMHQPRWLLARSADFIALGLQAVALAHGELVLVQAIMTFGVVIALSIEAGLDHRWLRARELAGSLAITSGVALVVGVTRHAHARPHVPILDWTIAIVIGLAVVVALMVMQRSMSNVRAATTIAGATALCFTFDAGFLKAAGLDTRSRGLVVATVAPIIGFLVAAAIGNLLVQRAFHLAPLGASLPVLTAAQPIFGVVLGAALYHERPTDGAVGYAIAIGGLTLLAIGAWAATHASGNRGSEIETPRAHHDATHHVTSVEKL